MELNAQQRLTISIILIAGIVTFISTAINIGYNERQSRSNAQLMSENYLLEISSFICESLRNGIDVDMDQFNNTFILPEGESSNLSKYFTLDSGYKWINNRGEESLINYIYFNDLKLYIYTVNSHEVLLKSFYESKNLTITLVVIRLILVSCIIIFITGYVFKPFEIRDRESRKHLKTIINSIKLILINIDEEKNIIQMNKTAENTLGETLKELSGNNVYSVLPFLREYDEFLVDVLSGNLKSGFDEKGVKWKERYYNFTFNPLIGSDSKGVLIQIEDVTERRKIDELLVQNEKMLSVGGLAAGMAHEINNPLGGMMQNSEVIKNRLYNRINVPAGEKAAIESGTTTSAIRKFIELRNIPEMLDGITSSGFFIKDIVNDILGFSKKAGHVEDFFVLNSIIDKALDLASKELTFNDLRIVKEYNPEVPFIQCDNVKIQQVILNILVNASHALKADGTSAPMIYIQTDYSPNTNSGIIKIRDNGPGMSEDVRKRIFEPFFTTKRHDLGTGLGLSVSYFIITENHNGSMVVESSPGKGAEFTITLPVKHS